jgi:hypothetical protein
MKQTVHIDRTTIKVNENAGSTTTILPGKKSVYFEGAQLPKDFIDGDNCVVYEEKVVSGQVEYVRGILLGPLSEDIDKRDDVKITFEVEPNIIHHQPIPKYSFEYVNELLVCDECGCKIHYNELRDDEVWGGEWENWIENICPRCGEADCVDLEYEKIEDVI